MKPYFLAIYNKIRLSIKRIQTNNIKCNGIQLFSRNMKLKLNNTSSLSVGDRVLNDGRLVIMVDDNANLDIGSHVYFNEDVMISCKSNVSIGDNCLFGPNVKIFDNNHIFDSEHGVTTEHVSSPITIGANCWIGANAVILKGTNIGDNCVIGAGCVVRGNIPTASIVTQGRDLNIKKIDSREYI